MTLEPNVYKRCISTYGWKVTYKLPRACLYLEQKARHKNLDTRSKSSIKISLYMNIRLKRLNAEFLGDDHLCADLHGSWGVTLWTATRAAPQNLTVELHPLARFTPY